MRGRARLALREAGGRLPLSPATGPDMLGGRRFHEARGSGCRKAGSSQAPRAWSKCGLCVGLFCDGGGGVVGAGASGAQSLRCPSHTGGILKVAS